MSLRFKLFALIIIILGIGLISINYTSDLSMDYLTEKYTDEHSAFIQIEGMNVHYSVGGISDDSLPIVLLHGTGASLHTWDNWTKKLSGHKKVVRMDLPAFGLTGPNPSRDYSMEFYARFMITFLDSLKIQKCILGGNSLGGGVALMTAANVPDRVKYLILCDATGYPSEAESTPLAMRMARVPIVKSVFNFITPRSVVRKSVEDVYFDKTIVTDDLVDRYYELALRPGNRQAFIDRMNLERFPDMSSKIKALRMPVLILWGENDRLIPVQNAYNFNRDLPASKLHIFKNCGHVPMEEMPDASLEPVLSFINQSL